MVTETAFHSAYSQMLSVGLVWISIHCAGMCGPLLTGMDVGGVARGLSPWQGISSVLAYQAGRALTYTGLGALVGMLGASITQFSTPAGGILTLVLGFLMITGGAFKGGLIKPQQASTTSFLSGNRIIGTLIKVAGPLVGGRGLLRPFALGVLLGFMPCMISIWALTLAATTSSPLHGAMIMWLLVLLTTPMLLGVTTLPRLIHHKWANLSGQVPAVLMGLSGVWLLLAGSAGMGWIHHAHFGFDLWGTRYAVMFW